MENSNQQDTLPTRPESDPSTSTPPKKRLRWPLWTLLGVVGLALIAAASGLGGYNQGISLRKSAQSTQIAQQLQEQFNLGVQELEDGQYSRARQRFEYVIRNNPSYPGAEEKLSLALLSMNSTATPTPAPTPTITPTPDNRKVDELFPQAQQSLANSDWSAAIDTLLRLRKVAPEYQPVAVDDMLFLALRNRGVDKILKQADLEGGIYDLTLAGRFGPLDTEAQSYETWARIYITGASFWEIDWAQAVQYFQQVAPALPNLRDGSGLTAQERYRLALIGYGDQLFNDEQWCDAQAQYEQALNYGGDQHAEDVLQEATKKCEGGGEEDKPSRKEKTPEPPSDQTPTEPAPTEAPPPTPEATQSPYP